MVPLAALLLATACAAGAADNPAAAIAAAAGHPASLHLLAAASDTSDGESETKTLALAGVKRLDRICVADLCRGTWFDGTHFAAFGINGTPWPDEGLDERAERTFAAIASTAFAEPAFIAAGGTVDALPADGDTRLRYRVTAPQGAELVAVADAQTHRLAGVEFPDRRLYRPLRATVWGTTIVYTTQAYDRITALDAPLVPPAGPRVTVSEAEVPVLSSDLPIVGCTLRGRRARCLIDTGTTPSAVTLNFAEQLGEEPRGQIEIAGLHPYLTGVIDAGPLALAGAVFDRLHLAVIPRTSAANFDVIVGSDALGGLRLAFDAAARRVQIAPSAPATAGRPIPLTFADGLPYATMRLGTRATRDSMLVDTGDSETLSIGYDAYREDMGLFAVRSTASASGLGGAPMDALQGELAHAEIGGKSLEGLAISAVRGQHVGHIGYGFAAHCGRLIVDLGQGRIECTAAPAAAGQNTAAGDHGR